MITKDVSVPLRERCVDTALTIIGEHGLDKLSLRDVARRLGVSHQAPYKHFPSRDHLLAEIVRRCFARFNAAMAASPTHRDPMLTLRERGLTYLRFAAEHPLEYRLMFGDPIPDKHDHPEMLAEAHYAFHSLQETVAAVEGVPSDDPRAVRDAFFVWSTVHGFATICKTKVMEQHNMHGPTDHAMLGEAVLKRICDALPRGDAASDAAARSDAE